MSLYMQRLSGIHVIEMNLTNNMNRHVLTQMMNFDKEIDYL